jgi:hypothetical protein
MISRNFKDEGVLNLNVEPDFDVSHVRVDSDSEKLRKSKIEDFIEFVED